MSDRQDASPTASQPNTAGVTPSDDRIEKMLDESSSHCRNLLYLFVLLLFYIFLTTAAVTDRDLLIAENTVKLPLLDIGLPLFGFFIAAPALVILLHLNLVMELVLHAQKLAVWKELPGRAGAVRVYPFIFNYAGYPRGVVATRLPAAIAWIMVFMAPLVVMVWIALGFLPYHSYPMTLWHRVAIWIDFAIILAFWYRIRRPREDADPTVNNTPEKTAPAQWFARFLAAARQFIAAALRPIREIGLRRVLTSTVPVALLLTLLTFNVITIPETNEETFLFTSILISEHIHRNLTVREEILVKTPAPDAIIAAYSVPRRSVDGAWLEHAVGLNLRGRDLRFADLSGCKLWNVDLRDAIADNIHLDSAQLGGGKLGGARLNRCSATRALFNNGVDLRNTEFNGADLRDAGFIGAELEKAQFNDAILVRGLFNNAQLHYAHFNGALLDSAQFNGANADSVQFNGAFLAGAQFNGAGLVETQFNGAWLGGSQFNGATLVEAQFNGANLGYAQFNGAIFGDAQFNGAKLSNAQFCGSIFGEAEFSGADITTAWLAGTKLPDTAGSIYYSSTYDTTSTPNWQGLRARLHDSLGIRDLVRLSYAVEGIDSAEARCNRPFTAPNWLRSDSAGFIAARVELACTSSVLADGMLERIHNPDDVVGIASTRAIDARLKATCPDTLAVILRRHSDREKRLRAAGLLP